MKDAVGDEVRGDCGGSGRFWARELEQAERKIGCEGEVAGGKDKILGVRGLGPGSAF
jgi:hypothetical protein